MNNKESNILNESMKLLLEPFTLGNLALSNRIVLAPMLRKSCTNGVPDADVANYYKLRAKNEVGLIITGGTVINHPASANDSNVPHFYGKDALDGWKHVVSEVHKAGGKIMPQIWHVGMTRKIGSSPNPEVLPMGPSGLAKPGVKVSDPMTKSEINAVIESFAEAAADAKRVGFDGIEIHGAHGYLIDQFFWSGTNQRTDSYGGDIVARTNFASEIIQACRSAVGSDFPIIFRFSQWKIQNFNAKLASTPNELEQFLIPLANAGVDVFHCSTLDFNVPEFEGSNLNLAGWTKKLTGKPTITVGSVGLDNQFLNSILKGKDANRTSIDSLVQMLERGDFDLVAIGRALLSDPSWVIKMKENRINDIIPFSAKSLNA